MYHSSTLENNSAALNANFALYVINLDRSKERWARINDHLTGYGLTAKRISAVDAKAIVPQLLEERYSAVQ